MPWIDRWERRLRPYAIPYLTNVLVAFQAVVYIAVLANGGDREAIVERFGLIPEHFFAGEVWRLLSFPMMPPTDNPLWAFFYFYLFYLMGNVLETRWGPVAYNLYVGLGLIATATVGLAGAYFTPDMAQVAIENHFIYLTIFLAFAYLNPDFTLMLFFILPIKIKWLAYLTWAGFALTFFVGDWMTRLTVLASVFNFLVFFGPDMVRSVVASKRKMERQASKISASIRPTHVCATCGINNLTHPEEEFRYCSKCDGTPAYCSRHLSEHEHISQG